MFPISWFEFALAVTLVTIFNVIVIVWLTRMRLRSARLASDSEHETLRSENETLRRELAEARIVTAQPIEPPAGGSAYERAIHLARAGSDVNSIANACAITRGEAELIVALHRSGISAA